MDSYTLVIYLTGIVIISYLYNIISRKIRVPSVLLLLGTGIFLRNFFDGKFLPFDVISRGVETLGIIGLIMIILEAALDLNIRKDKLLMIGKAFFSALIILIVSSFFIAYMMNYMLKEPFVNCLIYAVPLSIVSSAIVLPSVDMLTPESKEFIIYEASFSDILGILLFNYLISVEQFTPLSGVIYGGKIVLGSVLSFIVALILIYLLSKITLHVKFFLMFAVLIALYTIGKLLQLPSLIIILLFGLLVNNPSLIRPKKLLNYINIDAFRKLGEQLKDITAETSFIVRTFFFLLFGYSINTSVLIEKDVLVIGTMIVLLLLLVRFTFLKYLNPKQNPLPELLIMPRGLITILLFYNIPEANTLVNFNQGILFYVILVTSFLMMIGLLVTKQEVVEGVESSDHHLM
ncbi:MAG: Kef-type K+ transport system membrane component KefB [Spirosomataceae bacterium]|jgi:Kef-type K+ transport system membrane component KefB